MPCDPRDNNLNPPVLPPPPAVPGFGIPFAPNLIPYPDVAIPDEVPEDILALIAKIFAFLPGGLKLEPMTSESLRDVLDAVSSLLAGVMPWLGFYTFFKPVLDLLLCILDVICAIPNPFKLVRAIRRLFKECIPPFLNLFPWFALIALIISLMFLLLEILTFVLVKLLEFIEQLLANLLLLAEAASQRSAETILAVTLKIAYLFCIFEQVFAIFVMFRVIIDIVKSLLGLTGKFVCFGDDDCPPFPEAGITGDDSTSGVLYYLNEETQPLDPSLPPLRSESWQFGDLSNPAAGNRILDITEGLTQSGKIANFWPDPLTFSATDDLTKVPYTVDMELDINLQTFHSSFPPGLTRLKIKQCIVTKKPTTNVSGIVPFQPINSGAVQLVGGLVFKEDDTPFSLTPGGPQATLETLIHLGPSVSPFGDQVIIGSASYTVNVNYEALVDYNTITLGCVPEVAFEIQVAALRTGDPNISLGTKVEPLPDIDLGQRCLEDALNKLRLDVSAPNVSVFQAEVEACVETMRIDTLSVLLKAICAGADRFASTIAIDPDVQFINLPIRVSVELFDGNNTPIAASVPEEIREEISSKLEGQVTLGTISGFIYDPEDGQFKADINSSVAGDGELTVTFDGETFVNTEGLDPDDQTAIVPNVVPYTFVGIGGADGGSGREEIPRRDISDSAAAEGGN